MPLCTTDAEIRRVIAQTRTIAIVGLSDNPARDSYGVAQYLQRQGFTIIPVNPALTEVLGERVYPDLASIGHPVDLVDVFRRPEHVPPIVDAAIALGARALWTQLGVAHPEAERRAAGAGLDVVSNRCLAVEHRRLAR